MDDLLDLDFASAPAHSNPQQRYPRGRTAFDYLAGSSLGTAPVQQPARPPPAGPPKPAPAAAAAASGTGDAFAALFGTSSASAQPPPLSMQARLERDSALKIGGIGGAGSYGGGAAAAGSSFGGLAAGGAPGGTRSGCVPLSLSLAVCAPARRQELTLMDARPQLDARAPPADAARRVPLIGVARLPHLAHRLAPLALVPSALFFFLLPPRTRTSARRRQEARRRRVGL